MTAHWWPAYIGIGSNLGHPAEQVRNAIAAIAELPQCRVILKSPLYESAPLGPSDQPNYVNAVIALLTQGSAEALLEQVQGIERGAGRDRTSGERWGPRTLDLDILAWSDRVSSDERLTLPHPGIALRNFVLFPWRDITPYYRVPGLGTVAALAGNAPETPSIRKLV